MKIQKLAVLLCIICISTIAGAQTNIPDKESKTTSACAATNNEEHEVLRMERAALDRGARGDVTGFLEISADDVVYFDPDQYRRLDGIAALTKLYEPMIGQGQVDSYELINPKVQECGDAAVLTFNYESVTDGKKTGWNCTEVYRKGPQGWRIIQTHWSLNKNVK